MRTISARHSTFIKRVLPFLVVAGASAWATWRTHGTPMESVGAAAIGTVVVTIVMVVILRRGFWRMADIVEDDGDSLRVTRWRTRITIPLSNVREVQRVPLLRGSEVTLTLKQPCLFGLNIRFLAPDKRRVPDIDIMLEALTRRVQARQS